MSQNSQAKSNEDSARKKKSEDASEHLETGNTSKGTISIPRGLPDYNKHDILYFLLFETIALWSTILTNQGMSEQSAELELQELARLEELLAFVIEIIDPRKILTTLHPFQMVYAKAEQLRNSLGLPRERVFLELVPTSVEIPRPSGELSEISSILQTIPYQQRKVVVIYYTLELLTHWWTLLNKLSSRESSEIDDKIWNLITLNADTERSLFSIVSVSGDLYLYRKTHGETSRLVSLFAWFLENAVELLEETDLVNLQHNLVPLRDMRDQISRYYVEYHDYRRRFPPNEKEIPEEVHKRIVKGMDDVIISLAEGVKPEKTRRELLQALFKELQKLNTLDYLRQFDILPSARMKRLERAIQAIPVSEAIKISPAMKLHQQLESAGVYEKLDPRRRAMLQTYLTTETTIPDLGKLPEVRLKSRSQLTGLLHSGMEVAFNELPEKERAEYNNDPAIALRTRTAQQTQTKSEKIKDALKRYRNPETGTVEFSESHKQHRTEAVTKSNQRRGQQIREGTYSGKPLGGRRPGAGRPRMNGNTST